MGLYSFKIVILTAAVVVNLLLVSIVYRQDAKSAVNKIFAALGLVMSFWLVASYLSVTPVADLLWTRITVFLATVMSMLFFLLAHTLPGRTFQLSRKKMLATFVSTAIVMIITISPFAFTHIDVTNGVYRAVPGPGMMPFAALTTFFSLSAFYLLLKKFYKSKDDKKKQLKYVLIGILLMVSLIITTIMLPVVLFNNDTFVQLAPLYALIFLGMTAIAILKYHLFDIRIIATELLVTLLVIILIFEGFSAGSWKQVIFKILFSVILSSLGVLLVRSIKKEVAQREREEQLNHQLAIANSQLKELLQMKSEFLDVASHQLRTPLSAMIGLLSMQYEGDFDALSKEEQKEQQKNMLVSSERLRGIVNDLMDAMEVEGGIQPKLEPTDMNKLVQEAITTLKPNYDESGLTISYTPPSSSLPKVQADSALLLQMFMNLVDNARHYTEKGGVTIKLFHEGNNVVFEIVDTGIGITADEKAKLFSKFARSKRAMLIRPDGSGLGLFIVKKIVDAHHGKVEIYSEGVGKGTMFRVWLPISADKKEDASKI